MTTVERKSTAERKLGNLQICGNKIGQRRNQKDISKCFEINDDEDTTQQNLPGATEAGLRRKCTAVSDYIKKEEISPIFLTFHIKTLEDESVLNVKEAEGRKQY